MSVKKGRPGILGLSGMWNNMQQRSGLLRAPLRFGPAKKPGVAKPCISRSLPQPVSRETLFGYPLLQAVFRMCMQTIR